MTSINTGPTATALHHLLAAMQDMTGLDPLLLLWFLFVACAVVATATGWAIDRAFRHPGQRELYLRKGGR